jgi:hypothetical protein
MADPAIPISAKPARKPRSVAPDKHTLTIQFTEPEDIALYEAIVSGAKHDRRQPGQFALLKLHELLTPAETNESNED